jgi:mannose-6-phosphate isomerase-like protein (cupin superfamily)
MASLAFLPTGAILCRRAKRSNIAGVPTAGLHDILDTNETPRARCAECIAPKSAKQEEAMSLESRTEAKDLQPVIMRPGDAEAIRPFGIDMKVMLGAEHTGGTFSAIVAEVKPGEGPPPHLHRDREEYFFVLEGTYSLGVNGKESSIGPGTLVFVPRGTVHTFKNTSSSMGKLLEWTIPGDNGDYFRAMHKMETESGFNPETFAEINERFVTEFVG